MHVSGSAPYTDDLPELAGTLHAALGLSPVANGVLRAIDLQTIRAMPGVVAVLTSADIQGVNDCGSIVHDDPILAPIVFDDNGECATELRFVGQPVFAVIATTRDIARRAAAKAKTVMKVESQPPVLTAREAHAKKQYVVPPMHLSRETSEGGARAAIAASPHRLTGSFEVGGQEQF